MVLLPYCVLHITVSNSQLQPTRSTRTFGNSIHIAQTPRKRALHANCADNGFHPTPAGAPARNRYLDPIYALKCSTVQMFWTGPGRFYRFGSTGCWQHKDPYKNRNLLVRRPRCHKPAARPFSPFRPSCRQGLLTIILYPEENERKYTTPSRLRGEGEATSDERHQISDPGF